MNCPICGEPIVKSSRGRKRIYCNDACKQSALRKRNTVRSATALLQPIVYVGDSLVALQTILSESVDFVFGDPPYNVGKAEWDYIGNGKEYQDWLRPYLIECHRILKPTGLLALSGAPSLLRHPQTIIEDELSMVFQNWIVWQKRQGGRNARILMRRHEDILLYSKTDNPWFDATATVEDRHPADMRTYNGRTYSQRNIGDVWLINPVDSNSSERTDHPTQKPLELVKRLIMITCPVDGLVVDPFGGSGTTSVAAIELQRRSIYLELSQEYTDIAVKRFKSAVS